MSKLKVLYAGSPLASAMVLKTLIASSESSGFEIAGVLTNPPSAKGRHKELIPTEVAQVASENDIAVFAFDHLMKDAREAIAPLKADILVSFDYGRIFGPKFLAMFALGGINLHPSALPKYRGCAPVPAAILNGDKTLGISVQKIALKTDEGDLLKVCEYPLDGTETTLSLMDGDGTTSAVTETGAKMLLNVLQDIVKAGEPYKMMEAKPQSGQSSYTYFMNKDDGIIDWTKQACCIDRQIRAYTPWPLCSTVSNGTKLLVLKAFVSNNKTDQTPGTVLPYNKGTGIEIACGNGSILVATELQWQGKKAMGYKDFMNGARNFTGSILG